MGTEWVCTKQEFPQWRVLHVLHNREKKVALHLRNHSIEYFLPLYTERSRWSDRTVMLERPLFPGYLFGRFARAERRSVISSPGVLRILGNEEGNTVEHVEIERIRTAISDGHVLRPSSPIWPGIRVRVINGVFTGTEGMVTELRSNCKVIISMAAVKQCYSLETNIGDLEILDRKVVRREDGRELIGQPKLR